MILDQPLTNLQAWAHANLPLNEYTVLSVVTVSYLLRILTVLYLFAGRPKTNWLCTITINKHGLTID